ncbi:pectate lyase [Dyadobacter psychrotolerans]|uniref:Pectate lyase n=1 Tax=Dyadobacter psychrotolerans TaxID=2541721 RepID=A0A4R5DWT8_9BACT|nr:pectate lyase [Dyadobacter psychrotolerans]TDE16621.1 pectate lyase [Dyadobacter psychrotolerans]
MKHLLYLSVCLFCITTVYPSTDCVGKNHFAKTSSAAIDTTAEKMLLSQRISGGWPKQIDTKAYDYDNAWSTDFIKRVKAGFNAPDATIDNHATSREIRYLVKSFDKTQNKKYLDAAETGIRYLLKMQYANGGFPQFFPDTSGYRKHITYNDNAMLNALRVLQDVSESKNGFDKTDPELKKQSGLAVEKGISCILKTQIRINGKMTVWCAQHDHLTYLPAKARAYELPSFSAAESVDITRFLMEVKNPSDQVKEAVKGAVAWLSSATIIDFKTERIDAPSLPKGKDVVLVASPGSKIWGRFYDLETGKTFFCGRDGIKKTSLSEIEHERRIGYAYYGTWPEKLLTREFPAWLTVNK